MTTSANLQNAYRPKRGFPWGRTFAWIAMALLLFITLFPFWWMIRTALTAPKAVFLDTSSVLKCVDMRRNTDGEGSLLGQY